MSEATSSVVLNWCGGVAVAADIRFIIATFFLPGDFQFVAGIDSIVRLFPPRPQKTKRFVLILHQSACHTAQKLAMQKISVFTGILSVTMIVGASLQEFENDYEVSILLLFAQFLRKFAWFSERLEE